MLTKRRHIWAIGLAIGVLVILFFLLGPKTTVEQRIAENVAILAREPWHTIHVQRIAFRGPQHDPTDAFVYGARPDGTPVVVQFVDGSPYTSATAMRRLSEDPLAGRTAEFVLIPRSLVHKSQQDRFDATATHAGIALFAGVTEAEVSSEDAMEMTPAPGEQDGNQSEDSKQEEASHG